MKKPEPQTPMEIADGIREMLKKERLAICTLPSRHAMDLVLEHLSYDEKKRTRFQFHN